MLLGMGNDEAAVAATRVIQRWQPAHIMMVGIAGGVPGKVGLGDVVVAEACYYYELAKRTPRGEQRRPQEFTTNRLLLELDEAVSRLANTQGVLFGALARRGDAELVFHGIPHIPLAVLAGHLVTDRQRVRMFDFHPDFGSGTWAWPDADGEDFPPPQINGLPKRKVTRPGDAVIRLSVSYQVNAAQTRGVVPSSAFEVDLTVPIPERGVVKSEEQARTYGHIFRRVIDGIAQQAPGCQRIHLFYSGPVSLAFHLGQQISANIHPAATAWNFRRGAYDWGIDLAAAAVGSDSVVYPPTGE